MTRFDRRLGRQLTLALLIKIALLTALWWEFVRPTHVDLSIERVIARIGAMPHPQGEPR